MKNSLALTPALYEEECGGIGHCAKALLLPLLISPIRERVELLILQNTIELKSL
ncbi:unnamed protein product [marine sediment metagenome]|uniref:Uncharacterized protein n=1 Tax=marine sediment metagenome TaxID=412755 RepID=X1DQA6_9ZZZZ